MKRLMCLSLLLCLGAGVFVARGFAAGEGVIFDLSGSNADLLGDANENGGTGGVKYGANGFLGSVAWSVGANSNAPIAANTITGSGTGVTVAIGSSAAASTTINSYGDLDVDVGSTGTVSFVNLLIGGVSASYTDGLHDFNGTSGGNVFSASFGKVISRKEGAASALQVLVGNKAEFIKIADLTAKTAAVQGDLATGNALELTKLSLVGNDALVSSVAGGGNSTLTIGTLARNVLAGATAGDEVEFAVTSVGTKVGKLIFTNDITLGGQSGNKDTVTFSSGTGAGDAAAVLEAQGHLTLNQLGIVNTPAANGDLAFATTGKGLITVAKNLEINTLAGGSLEGVDVRADGSAVINNAAGTAATLTLGDNFTANGVTVNGSGTAANTLTVTVGESLKSSLATAATGTPGTDGYVAPGFTPNTITVDGNKSGVVLTGADAATSKVYASVVRVVGGGNTAATNNKITSLDVRSDLVVGTADAPAYLTVTTSNLKNLTQNRGITTFATGATHVDGMTTISGKDSVNNGRVIVSAGSTFGAGITVNTGGVLQGAAGGIVLGRSATTASGTEGQAGYIASRDAVTGELILNGGTIQGLNAVPGSAAAFSIRAVDATASTDGTLARMLVRGVGNTIDGGMVDASTLDLTMDAGAGLTINDGATLLVRNAVQNGGEVKGENGATSTGVFQTRDDFSHAFRLAFRAFLLWTPPAGDTMNRGGARRGKAS